MEPVRERGGSAKWPHFIPKAAFVKASLLLLWTSTVSTECPRSLKTFRASPRGPETGFWDCASDIFPSSVAKRHTTRTRVRALSEHVEVPRLKSIPLLCEKTAKKKSFAAKVRKWRHTGRKRLDSRDVAPYPLNL